jgi:DNA-binding response OmpR family regulator
MANDSDKPAAPNIERDRPLEVFVVEDCVQTRRWLKLFFEDRGHIVQTARDLDEALLKLPKARCDLLIADISLPDGSGWELMRKVALSPNTFTVALSALGSHNDKVRSHEAGFQRHMVKPINSRQLDDVIREAREFTP